MPSGDEKYSGVSVGEGKAVALAQGHSFSNNGDYLDVIPGCWLRLCLTWPLVVCLCYFYQWNLSL